MKEKHDIGLYAFIGVQLVVICALWQFKDSYIRVPLPIQEELSVLDNYKTKIEDIVIRHTKNEFKWVIHLESGDTIKRVIPFDLDRSEPYKYTLTIDCESNCIAFIDEDAKLYQSVDEILFNLKKNLPILIDSIEDFESYKS